MLASHRRRSLSLSSAIDAVFRGHYHHRQPWQCNRTVTIALVIGFVLLLVLVPIHSLSRAPSQSSSTLSDAGFATLGHDRSIRSLVSDNDSGDDDTMLDELQREYSPYSNLTHLVIVNGHAVLTALIITADTVMNASSWLLLDYQMSQLSTFITHIETGVKLAANDRQSLLLFSGSETRRQAGMRSEAQSYWLVCEAMDWFGHSRDGADWLSPSSSSLSVSASGHWNVRSRTSTEEHARDSYENLVFSICRFHELTGRYPSKVTVIGFDFKRERFLNLHRSVIKYPSERFEYIGVDPDNDSSSEARLARERGERKNSLQPFTADPHGCHESLRAKRKERNPFHRSHGYGHDQSCPELKALLHHCGNVVYQGALPWTAD